MSCQMIRADDWDAMVRSMRAQEVAAGRSSWVAADRLKRTSPVLSALLLETRSEDELLALLVQARTAERHLYSCVQEIQHELAVRCSMPTNAALSKG
jgi:hypothetical protein